MKVIGLNGSPRLKGNSMKLLNEAMRGAQEAGAETQMMQLYGMNFKGCRSCFACKSKTPFYGKGCAMKDDFTKVMEDMLEADAWVFASPIYNGHMSSSMSALLERLYFSHHNYDAHERMVDKEYPSLLLYSLNGNQMFLDKMGIENSCKYDSFLMQNAFGSSKYMVAKATLQFDDYGKYHTAAVPVEKKTEYSKEHFPQDLNNAYELGKDLVARCSEKTESPRLA
ncbi:MAG: flavodoxin family protein [Selenomonadaceae bacterium]|nr:flavodoxin family protein [Selenomonadaceae bacterium]